MSGTLPPIESADDQLADEISDVIEQHGRGLDAEEVSSAVDRVARHLEEEFDEAVSANELQHELHRFVDEHLEQMAREEFVETLREIADDLRQGTLTPDVEYRRDEQWSEEIALVFDSAFVLRQQMSHLLDFRGYFVECEHIPVAREEIDIVIEASHIEMTVELKGAVVRTAPNGMALKIYEGSADTRDKLRDLTEQMRAKRRETS